MTPGQSNMEKPRTPLLEVPTTDELISFLSNKQVDVLCVSPDGMPIWDEGKRRISECVEPITFSREDAERELRRRFAALGAENARMAKALSRRPEHLTADELDALRDRMVRSDSESHAVCNALRELSDLRGRVAELEAQLAAVPDKEALTRLIEETIKYAYNCRGYLMSISAARDGAVQDVLAAWPAMEAKLKAAKAGKEGTP